MDRIVISSLNAAARGGISQDDNFSKRFAWREVENAIFLPVLVRQ